MAPSPPLPAGFKVFVGIDTSKLKNAVAVAEAGRDGEVRYLGTFGQACRV